MNDITIYSIGFFLGTFFGVFFMGFKMVSILKDMGIWLIVKAWLKGCKMELSVQVVPSDEKSRIIMKRLVERSIRRGECKEAKED